MVHPGYAAGVFVEGFYLQYEFVVFSYAAGEFVHAHNKEYRRHHSLYERSYINEYVCSDA